MPSRINIGPEGGPFVELDEENGEFVIRVPEDEVNFDQSDLRNVKDFTAGSVSTDDLNNTVYGSEVISGLPSVSDAVATALSKNGVSHVAIVGSGTHILDPITQDIVGLTIEGIGDVTLQNAGDSTFLFDNVHNSTFKNFDLDCDNGWGIGVEGNAVTIDNVTVSAWDRAIQVGRGRDLIEDVTIKNCQFDHGGSASRGAVFLNRDTHRLKITENKWTDTDGFECIYAPNSHEHREAIIDNNQFTERPNGGLGPAIDITGELKWSKISDNELYTFDGFVSIDRPFSCSIVGNSGRVGGGVFLTNPRDTTVTGNSFQGGGGAGIEITLESASEYQDSAGVKCEVVANNMTNFNRAGIHLQGASYCTVAENLCGQNSDTNPGEYSGIMLEDVTLDGTVYGTVNCVVSGNITIDTHSTKTQDYGVEELGAADYNIIKNNQVAPNLTGGVSSVGVNSIVSDNISTQA